MKWQIIIPGKVISPNVKTHWSKAYRNNKKHITSILWRYQIDKPHLILPATITLTRIAPRPYDYDNLVSAFKGIRDTIASLFFPDKPPGFADSSPDLTWEYTQQRGGVKENTIQITIQTKE